MTGRPENLPPLFGLVLAGGASRRMHTDKAGLAYGKQPQLAHAHALLTPFVERVFVSVRPEQAGDPLRARFAQIADVGDAIGPLGGLLAAQRAFSAAAWLVLACDLPLLDTATLQTLVDARAVALDATAFLSAHDGLPEPLCAIWEPGSHAAVVAAAERGSFCLRKLMIASRVRLLPSPGAALDNANTPEEAAVIRQHLAGAPA